MEQSRLNDRAASVVEQMILRADDLRISPTQLESGGRVIDCGIAARGGLQAGLELARICLADLASVLILPGEVGGVACPHIQLATDHPVRACLASQYAGWPLSAGKFFAMASGPMRAARGKEPILERLAVAERPGPKGVVGVLEGRKLPSQEVVASVAEACGVEAHAVTLLIAPTASLAGGVQIVARSVETCLHKLAELQFDLSRVISAHGIAPLPPVSRDDLAAIGRTNDSILYGARVVLYVTGDDASLIEVGPKIPSASSHDHGEPFATVFARYGNDFYKVDPHLFSPAEVVLQNMETGATHRFGQCEPQILARSFFGSRDDQ